MDTNGTIEVLLKMVFYTRSMQRGLDKIIGSWRGAVVQRVLAPGSRGIAIVRSLYEEDTAV
jgi:hypothetical protein